ncbi:MAG: ABC-F family ATP-binding cassette domain-containing protein [Bacilli bacterium]|nr:ABC-F family ATP-binding cassette domain-containing protein [Bacilli bacterium]
MPLVELKNVNFNYGDKELYNNVNLKINPKEHCFLVGVNGSGKTTLFSLISKELRPDSGEVILQDNLTFSVLDQHLKIQTDQTVIDYLYGVYKDLFDKEKEMKDLYEKASYDFDNFEKILNKANNLNEYLVEQGFYALQEKVGKLINGLGISDFLLERKLSTLSSGQKEKIYLAKMLLEDNDFLLMDEPTNFLDANQIKWLSQFLQNYPNAFLIISHDVAFMKTVGEIFFSLENKTLTRYKGDYDTFIEAKKLNEELYKKNYAAQQRYIKKEEDFIQKHIVRATSAKAAKSRRARLAHVTRLAPPAKEEGLVNFTFPFSKYVGDVTVKIEDLEIGYDFPLLDPISLELKKNEKIAIIGENGVGKTTLVRTILGQIPKIGGSFALIKDLKINYFNQDEPIPFSLTPFDYFKQFFPNYSNTEVRTALGNVGVKKETALRKMSELSGGEITKTRLAILTKTPCNFLILDEPTNHLDQKAKMSLFQAIAEFPGTVILICHEKDFYDGLVDYEFNI